MKFWFVIIDSKNFPPNNKLVPTDKIAEQPFVSPLKVFSCFMRHYCSILVLSFRCNRCKPTVISSFISRCIIGSSIFFWHLEP